ncbi:hypothetical protein [Parabacteroides sp.]
MEIEMLVNEEELSAIKGGTWFYDPITGEWYWMEDVRTEPKKPESAFEV